MTTLRISNMHCGACVRRVTAALTAVPDTRVHSVEVGTARLQTSAADEMLVAAVAKAGFPAIVEHA